jgi:hypothetical protein
MTLEETEIYKRREEALDAMYQLEDLTGYIDKDLAEAILIMQKFDVKKACEENMFVSKEKEDT